MPPDYATRCHWPPKVSHLFGHHCHKVHSTVPVSYTHLDVYKRQIDTGFLEWLTVLRRTRIRIKQRTLTQNKIPIYNYNVANEPMLRDSGYGTVTYVYDNRYKQNYYCLLYTSRCV